MELKQLQSDPAAFRRELHIPTGRGSRKFGECMADFQHERFAVVDASLLAVTRHEAPPIPRVWDERTKGASKDTDWAVNLLWLLAFTRRPLRVQVGAYDQQQADELRQIVKGILRISEPLNGFLDSVIDVQTNRIVNTRTDSVVEILTTDKLGSHGARPDVVLIDELTHQQDKGFAETLLDNLDKMPFGFGIIAINAGHDPSWQLDWKRTFAESSRWRVLEYRESAPWVSGEVLAESRRRNSTGRFRRLWRGDWVGQTEGALDETDIDNCVVETGPMDGSKRGWAFVGGLDIGIMKHATGLVIVGRHVGWEEEKPKPKRPLSTTARAMIDAEIWEEPEEDEPEYAYHEPTHRLRLAHARAWKPSPGKRVSLEAVKVAILRAHERFNLQGVSVDPHQGEHIIELLEREGVPVERTPQTTVSLQEQATATIEAFQQRTIGLYQHDDMIADLKRLQVKDTGLKIRLVSPEVKSDQQGTGHGDLASALSFAVALAKSKVGFSFRPPSSIIAC